MKPGIKTLAMKRNLVKFLAYLTLFVELMSQSHGLYNAGKWIAREVATRGSRSRITYFFSAYMANLCVHETSGERQ